MQVCKPCSQCCWGMLHLRSLSEPVTEKLPPALHSACEGLPAHLVGMSLLVSSQAPSAQHWSLNKQLNVRKATETFTSDQ